MDFADKVILITGGSSGIGAGAAYHFAKLGARVAIVGRNVLRLNAMVSEIRKTNAAAPLAIVADVTKDAERIINETIKHFGRLDVLVNNAGILSPRSVIEELDLMEFDRTLNTNLRSVVELTKLGVPHLEKTRGNIVNISSISGMKPKVGIMTYSVSKAALNQFTKCAALELAAKGIRVNSVNPGLIKTPIFQATGINSNKAEAPFELTTERKSVFNGPRDKLFFEKSKEKYPLGRVGEVSDTSAAVAYFASENAGFVTGVIMQIDGGKMLTFTD